MASSAEEGSSPSLASPWRLSRSQSLSTPRRLSRSPSPPRGRSALSSSPSSRPRSRSWSAPSPPPSPPQAKAEKRSFYLFFDHGPGKQTRLTLCTVEVEIPSVYSPTCPVAPSPIPIVPTLLFGATDFPTPMRCVHLGSKFYFLGGQISLRDDEEVESFTRDQLYPPDVYIFDPTTPKANANANARDAKDFVTPGPPMNTGKPDQVFLFVAYGKIYALSPPSLRVFRDNYPLEYFEVFDPKTNKWACLPPPPFKNFDLQSHLIVKSKVYITAWQRIREFKLCCFDLNKKEWEPSVPLLSSQLICRGLHVSDLMDDIVENSLYWFGFLHNSIVASGPVEATEVADGECFKNLIRMSPVDTLTARRSCLGKFIHLGNRRICYVECYNPIVPPIPMNFMDVIYDAETLYMCLTIFETLSDTFADRDGRNYSNAKLLLRAIFVTKIPVDRFGYDVCLCNCSLIPIAANDAGFNDEAEL